MLCDINALCGQRSLILLASQLVTALISNKDLSITPDTVATSRSLVHENPRDIIVKLAVYLA